MIELPVSTVVLITSGTVISGSLRNYFRSAIRCSVIQQKFIDSSNRNDSYERRDTVILSGNKLPDVKQSELLYNTTC